MEASMKIHDISVTVTPDLPVWPGDPAIIMERVSKMEEGEHNNVTQLAISAHCGTHVDAPFHFVADGKTIETLPLDVLIGPAQVVELAWVSGQITAGDLERAGIQPGTERVLLKTSNSTYWSRPDHAFQKGFIALDPGAAAWLVARGVKLVGIDYFSIAPFGDSVPTHRALLEAEVVVLEGVDLSRIQPGVYGLYCLPLKLGGSDGAPARAVLVEEG
jgi:arylformamidase